MIEMSHHGELPIHFFWPLRIQVSQRSRLAVVVRPPEGAGADERLGQTEAANFSLRAIGGIHFCFCSSEPPR